MGDYLVDEQQIHDRWAECVANYGLHNTHDFQCATWRGNNMCDCTVEERYRIWMEMIEDLDRHENDFDPKKVIFWTTYALLWVLTITLSVIYAVRWLS